MQHDLQTITANRFDLTPANLEGLGLKEVDVAEIQQVALSIQTSNPASVAEFGRDVASHTSSYADSLLDQVRNSDLNEGGKKLTEVVTVARALNIGPLSDKRSKIPLIGPVIDHFRLRTVALAGKFDTTKEQIEGLLSEVQFTQDNIQGRNASLEQMFGAVTEEHRLLGVHIAAGRIRLDEMRSEAEAMRGSVGNDPARVQELADRDAMINNLDKRLGDLMALQQSAFQSLPMIRIIQANNQMLVDKFHTIKTITVPAWKRQFMLYLTLNEQKNAVELADTIDNTTNDLLKKNAALLHRNAVDTAKANQRLVIDVDTLKQVQGSLIKTVEDVIKIQADGVATRKAAEKEIQGMRLDMKKRITRQVGGAQLIEQQSEA